MAHSEACQLYIEQEIEEGLRKGKTPYSIGKELAGWVERLFEAKIPEKTLRKRAERSRNKLATNVANDATHQRHSEIDQKPSTVERGELGKSVSGTAPFSQPGDRSDGRQRGPRGADRPRCGGGPGSSLAQNRKGCGGTIARYC